MDKPAKPNQQLVDSTDLHLIKLGHPFTWGVIIDLWEFGCHYHLCSYHPWKAKNCIVLKGQPSRGISYHGWVDGKSCSFSDNDVDRVIAHSIAVRRDGPNTKADKYFIRMLQD